MITSLPNHRVMAVLMSVFLFLQIGMSQVNSRNIAGHEYVKYGGAWYTMFQGNRADSVDTNHLIVRLKSGGKFDEIDFASLSLPALKNVRGRIADGFYELKVPEGRDAFEIAEGLEKSGKFDDVLFNVFLKVHASPNDPTYQYQWNLSKVQMSNAWDVTTGSSSVIVAVLDVGGDYSHEDLAGNRWSGTGYDFYDGDSDPYPPDGAAHGTCVAGIMGAVTSNSTGVAGIAGGWNGSGGIRLMHMRVGVGAGIDAAAAAQAIDSAAAWGASVVNMSFGGGAYSPLESAINAAVTNHGVVIVASAGNYQSGDPTSIRYPAAYSNVIAVGATTENDSRKELNDNSGESWWGSCYGSQLGVVAPGIYVRTTDVTGSAGYDATNYFNSFNGTSAAAPHVAAVAGLIRSMHPSFTVDQVRKTILLSADKVSGMGGQNFTNEYGYGRVNADRAVRSLYVPDVYSTIESAVSAASNGQTIFVSSGAYTINSNVTVPSGVTLAIGSGCTLNFAANCKLHIEGKLTVNGTSSAVTTFTCSGGQWYGIEFYYGNNYSDLNNVIIENAQFGLYLYGTHAYVQNSIIRNNATGVFAYADYSTFLWNIFENNTRGFDCSYYGDPTISHNVLRYNSYAVYGDATSAPIMGGISGSNSFNYTGYYDIYTTYSGTINAQSNWWYPWSPNFSGNVDYSNYLSSDPNTWAGRFATPPNRPVLPPTLAKMSGTWTDSLGMKELDHAYQLLLNGRQDEALSAFRSVTASYPDAFSGARALAFVDHILDKSGRDAKQYLNTMVNQYPTSKAGVVAKSLLTGHLVKEGNYKGALDNAEALAKNKDKMIEKQALYDAGNIAWHYQGDKKNAEKSFRKLIKQYPDDPLSISAQSTLGEWSGNCPPRSLTSNRDPIGADSRMDNYPNPFNPTTVIRFSLPTDGLTSLKVFDVLGKEIAVLVNEFKKAGIHQARFDGSSISSGTYFYRLDAGGKRLVQRMILIK